jgi:hypothetical protein
MRVAGATEEMTAAARSSPVWPGLEALAHDAACMGNGRPPTARLATITRPTLVATGEASPDSFVGGGGDFFLFPEEDPEQVADLVVDIVANRLPRRFGLNPRDVQVLCPMHRGPAGAGY